MDERGRTVKESQVTLLHFSGWPDCDVPKKEEELTGFNKMMDLLLSFYLINNTGQKAVVHCRQGHGRTGTTVTILSRLLQAFYGTKEEITITDTLLQLRN